ncbi:hypothetical protein H1C71_029395 [Ictidomys tridecemlineatus]|nr:hypothetical protein H1C71_029395 [Ictidomys tridecemlineatus]
MLVQTPVCSTSVGPAEVLRHRASQTQASVGSSHGELAQPQKTGPPAPESPSQPVWMGPGGLYGLPVQVRLRLLVQGPHFENHSSSLQNRRPVPLTGQELTTSDDNIEARRMGSGSSASVLDDPFLPLGWSLATSENVLKF